MIGVRGGGRYRARIARVICGDPNPQGPGYREIPVSWALEGEHDGEEQLVAKGSWIDIPLLDLGTGERPIAFAATIWPTLIAADRQAVLSWRGGDAALHSRHRSEGSLLQPRHAGGPRRCRHRRPPHRARLARYRLPVRSSRRDVAIGSGATQGEARPRRAHREKRLGQKRPAVRRRCGRRRGRTFRRRRPSALQRQDRTAAHRRGRRWRWRGARDATHRRRDTRRDHHCRMGPVDRHPHGHGDRYWSGEGAWTLREPADARHDRLALDWRLPSLDRAAGAMGRDSFPR